MNYLLQVDFPFHGPFGYALTESMAGLAQDIATEEGLIWKIWTESAEQKTAGGVYLFDNEQDAKRYLAKHTERLESFGITDIRGLILQVNEGLSKINSAPL
ncbi:MAG: monooxygenase [Vibrio sp.]